MGEIMSSQNYEQKSLESLSKNDESLYELYLLKMTDLDNPDLKITRKNDRS